MSNFSSDKQTIGAVLSVFASRTCLTEYVPGYNRQRRSRSSQQSGIRSMTARKVTSGRLNGPSVVSSHPCHSPLRCLPDLTATITASYLTTFEVLQLCACSRWLTRAFRPHVSKLELRYDGAEGGVHGSLSWWQHRAALTSLLAGLKGLKDLVVPDAQAMGVLSEALRGRHCTKVSSLALDMEGGAGPWKAKGGGGPPEEPSMLCTALKAGAFRALRSLEVSVSRDGTLKKLAEALAVGACPLLFALSMHFDCEMGNGGDHLILPLGIEALGEALEAREEGEYGCVGFKRLSIESYAGYLGGGFPRLLLSGPLDGLEEIDLKGPVIDDHDVCALSDYMWLTGAESLRRVRLDMDKHDDHDDRVSLADLADVLDFGVAPNLHTLEICGGDMPWEHMTVFSRAVEKGSLCHLETLELRSCLRGGTDMSALMRGLSRGHGCPYLKVVRIEADDPTGAARALVKALSARVLPVVEVVEVVGWRAGEEGEGDERGGAGGMHQGGGDDAGPHHYPPNPHDGMHVDHHGGADIPSHRHNSCHEDPMSLLAKATTTRHACAHLRSLTLIGSRVCDDGLKAFVRALRSGACKGLTAMDLRGTGVTSEGIAVLASALAEGCCVGMKTIGVGKYGHAGSGHGDGGNSHTSNGLHAVVYGIGVGGHGGMATCASTLTELRIGGTCMGAGDVQRLAHALTSPHAAKLEVLSLDIGSHMATCGNRDGMMCLVDALRVRSVGGRLKELTLHGLDDAAGEALVEALEDGACPRLEFADVSGDDEYDTSLWKSVQEVLESRGRSSALASAM